MLCSVPFKLFTARTVGHRLSHRWPSGLLPSQERKANRLMAACPASCRAGPRLGTDAGRHAYRLGPGVVCAEEADDAGAAAHVQDDLVLQGLLVLQDDAVVLGCPRLVSQHFQVKFLKPAHRESLQGPVSLNRRQQGTLLMHPS